MQIDLKQATVYLKGGLQNEILEVKVGEGNITWTERNTREYTKNRGVLDEVRNGDEEPMEVRLEMTWEFLSSPGSGDPTPYDVLKRKGLAASWTSSDADTCRPYAVDVLIEYRPSCAGGNDADVETILFPDFRYEEISPDTRAGSISVTGKCNATEPTVNRAAAS